MYLPEQMSKIIKIFFITLLCNGLDVNHLYSKISNTFTNTVTRKLNETKVFENKIKYHVSIRLKGKEFKFDEGHICSGAVIGPSVVLTAAHCVNDVTAQIPYHPSKLRVILDHEYVFDVTHTYRLPSPHDKHLLEDLAILLMDQDISGYKKIIEPSRGNERGLFKVSGYRKRDKERFINHLTTMNANIGFKDSTVIGVTVPNDFICDVGAPLLSQDALVGILTNRINNSLMFTNVTYYAEWIQEYIGDGSNRNSSLWGVLGILILTFMAVKQTKLL